MGQFLTPGVQHAELAKGRLETQQAIQDLLLLFLGCCNRVDKLDRCFQRTEFLLDVALDLSGRILRADLQLPGIGIPLGLYVGEYLQAAGNRERHCAQGKKGNGQRSGQASRGSGFLLLSLHGSCHLIHCANERPRSPSSGQLATAMRGF